MKFLPVWLSLVLFYTTAVHAETDDRGKTLSTAIDVLEETMNTPDEQIPAELVSQAQAIIIFPTMVKGGFMVGARYGKGVASVRSKKNHKWGPPAFLYTTGLSFGLQIGAEAVDLILLVMTQRGIEGLLKGQFTLGGDIAISAGPIGRHAEASTDILMQGEIYSYSRSKGAFAGISIKGTVITADKEANVEYYQRTLNPKQILVEGAVKKYPETTKRFMKSLNRIIPYKKNPANYPDLPGSLSFLNGNNFFPDPGTDHIQGDDHDSNGK